jgi:hypothetical protein
VKRRIPGTAAVDPWLMRSALGFLLLLSSSFAETASQPPAVISATTLKAELADLLGGDDTQIRAHDPGYVIPEEAWLRDDFLPWFNQRGLPEDTDRLGRKLRVWLTLAHAQQPDAIAAGLPFAEVREPGKDTLFLIRLSDGWAHFELSAAGVVLAAGSIGSDRRATTIHF